MSSKKNNNLEEVEEDSNEECSPDSPELKKKSKYLKLPTLV